MERYAQKAFYGALAVLTLVALGAGMGRAGAEGLAFGLFAALTIGGALVCIWERSVVRSAFALMATFGGVAGLYVLLHADFLAMAQILIYVGAILVLLIFGVMLSPPDLRERKLSRVFAALLLVGAGIGWIATRVAATVEWGALPAPADLGASDNAERIGIGFLRADGYVVAFELAAIVLTVALVAAVYVARRKPQDLAARGPDLEASVLQGEGS